MHTYRSSRRTIRRFADRAICAAPARPAKELPSPTAALGREPGMRQLALLPAAEEPLLT